ncbi:MAG TPA: hypothetical protein VF070_29180 [Streptosporangiaceae bacterium]
MDANQVATLRALLAPTGWLERTRAFAQGLRSATRLRGGLLVVGTPTEEPWHLTAHLDEESRLAGIPELMPTLVRWNPPPEAPAHLRVGLSRLEAARRGETLFVVTPATAPVPLLERVSDARRIGATIFALDQGDPELDSLAHEALTVENVSFGAAQHLITAACGDLGEMDRVEAREFSIAREYGLATRRLTAAARERGLGGNDGSYPGYPPASSSNRYRTGVRGLRDRVARLLDTVSGPTA